MDVLRLESLMKRDFCLQNRKLINRINVAAKTPHGKAILMMAARSPAGIIGIKYARKARMAQEMETTPRSPSFRREEALCTGPAIAASPVLRAGIFINSLAISDKDNLNRKQGESACQ
jgi:hypothetical protein